MRGQEARGLFGCQRCANGCGNPGLHGLGACMYYRAEEHVYGQSSHACVCRLTTMFGDKAGCGVVEV